MDGYERLAAEVVRMAAEDYRSLRRSERRKMSEHEKSIHDGNVKSLERFFLSDYGNVLSFGKGEYILEQLKKEFE